MSIGPVKLFKIVTLNDADELEDIINTYSDVNYNAIARHSLYLLSRAVEVRAKEVFDLLLELKTLSNNHLSEALNIAIEYYVGSNLESNKYYFNRLVQKKFELNIHMCKNYKLIKPSDINWERIFKLLPEDEEIYDDIIKRAMESDNYEMFMTIYDILQEKPDNFFDYRSKTRYLKSLYEHAIEMNLLRFVKFFRNTLNDWTIVDNIPALYYSIHHTKTSSNTSQSNFPLTTIYLLEEFKNLNTQELNKVPYIKSFESLVQVDGRDYGQAFINRYTISKQVINFPVEFEDCSRLVYEFFNARLLNKPYYDLNRNHLMTYYLFANKLVKKNPLAYDYSQALKMISDMVNKSKLTNFASITSLKYIYYFIDHFNVEIPDNFKPFLKWIDIENDKIKGEKFMKTLEDELEGLDDDVNKFKMKRQLALINKKNKDINV